VNAVLRLLATGGSHGSLGLASAQPLNVTVWAGSYPL